MVLLWTELRKLESLYSLPQPAKYGTLKDSTIYHDSVPGGTHAKENISCYFNCSARSFQHFFGFVPS